MAYALQPMLRIRGMREDRAQTELAAARRVRLQAEQLLKQKQEARSQFEATKEERRDRIFNQVIGKVVTRQDLNDIRGEVTKIDEQAVLLEQDERKAEDHLQKKDEEVEAARLAHVMAAKDLMKITEHRKAWEEEDRKMLEMLADAEMEEFTGRKLLSDDDDTFD